MKIVRYLAVCVVLSAVTSLAKTAEDQIRKALNIQVTAWNDGDIPRFVATYAPDCIFVGKEVARGRAQLEIRYKREYPTREAMGHLEFNGLEILRLSPDITMVIGKWHLERSAKGGSSIGGVFSLVFQLQNGQWMIVLDHTS
jgi:uncharacterized protein (TIGR02246 family)